MIYSINVIKKSELNEIERIQDWMWPTGDIGMWNVCIADWLCSHEEHWFTYVKKYDVVVQAGGGAGLYPRILAQKFKHVYTFEPNAMNFNCLVANCQEDNIIKINGALGSRHEFVSNTIQGYNLNMGENSVEKKKDSFIPTFKIDDLNLKQCDLIALDIEGREHLALQGAVKTIKRHYPVVVAENSNNLQVHAVLDQFGYTIVGHSRGDVIWVSRNNL
jgi:FkbM family methyltransferase